jgi:hypothetical protein
MSIFNGQYISLNFFYDKARVAEEILQHKFTDIPAIKQFLSLRPFDLVEQSLYDKVTVLTEYGIIRGSVPSWKGYSFTHVLGDMMSNYGSNLSRIKYENWTWKDDANCPYIKEIVSQLGFTSVQNVRAMLLDPPGFGPVHNDLPLDSNYYDNHVSITLNIADGGKPLVAMIDSNLIEINDDCFIFRDNCWHGVGLVSSQRIQLRINGVIDEARLKFLL